jgi:hypothetical protein
MSHKLYDECPAIQELKVALRGVLPSVDLQTIAKKTPGTRHTSGIAMDIMLDMREPREYELANAVIAAVTDETIYSAMRWSDLIYSAWAGSGIYHYHIPGKEYHGYGGTPLKPNDYTADTDHEAHIHIDWVDFAKKNPMPQYLTDPYQWTSAAETTGFSAKLQAAIRAALASPKPLVFGDQSPSWLPGWWVVDADGDTEYYYFGLAGFVDWTDKKPASRAAPVSSPQNKGTCKVSGGTQLVITWNEVGGMQSVETFRLGAGHRSLAGSSNRGYNLTARKM